MKMNLLDAHKRVLDVASLLMKAHQTRTRSQRSSNSKHLLTKVVDSLNELADEIAWNENLSSFPPDPEEDADSDHLGDENANALEYVEVTGLIVEGEPVCVDCLEFTKMISDKTTLDGEHFFGLSKRAEGVITPHYHGVSKCGKCRKPLIGCEMSEMGSIGSVTTLEAWVGVDTFGGP